MKKLLYVVVCSIVIMQFCLGTAFAYNHMDYWVQAYDTSSSSRTGIHGHNYVMADPQVEVQHVSSLYVADDTQDNFSEVGWFARDTLFGRDVKHGMF